MKRILYFAVIAVLFATAGCRETKDPDFKSDDTPRWENGSTVQLSDAGGYTFITDAGGVLFGSSKYKTGRISPQGDFEMIEFSGSPVLGKPSEPSLRKSAESSVPLHSLEIVKAQGGKLWIVFKETESSAERRIVQ